MPDPERLLVTDSLWCGLEPCPPDGASGSVCYTKVVDRRGLAEPREAAAKEAGKRWGLSAANRNLRVNLLHLLLLFNHSVMSDSLRPHGHGASHVAPVKSGVHAHGEGERVIALESW